MGTTVSITDIYMNALSSLSDKEKLDLISKLTNSIIKKKKKKRLRTFMCSIASIQIGAVTGHRRKLLKTYASQGFLNVKFQLGSIESLWQNTF